MAIFFQHRIDQSVLDPSGEGSYTAGKWVSRSWEWQRYELDCANSCDALLMNISVIPEFFDVRRYGPCLAWSPGFFRNSGLDLAFHYGMVNRIEPQWTCGSVNACRGELGWR